VIFNQARFVISLEKINKATLKLKCYACRDFFLKEDEFLVNVSVPEQDPLRLHDGYCTEHFAYGLLAFIEHRDKMQPQESSIQ